ncbi:MAG TPA: hypothetical protein VF690_03610 [Hymenobacter sp.]|jgi:hypothetical protein
MENTTNQLPAEVAEHYELTSHVTKLFVTRLDREVDLTKLTQAEAAELVALPGGFEWLRKKAVPEPVAELVVTEVPRLPKRRRAPKNESPEGK